ncbi:MAG: caspase family protein [Proteobacteria bacterium]|nr:caspase family protein [Pseudomonadota bacterium]
MKILWSLTLLAMCSLAIGDTRGLKIRVKDPQGQIIELYSESHALLIGASQYQDPQWPDIESIPGELKQVEKILKAQGFLVQTHLDPTKRQLKNYFADFIDQYGYDKNNRLLFFFAGHGYTRQDGNKGYLVPVDAPSPLEDEKGFQRKALPMSQILAWARQTEAKHSLFLFDSCFSGTIFKSRALPEHPPAISTAVSRPVRQFITAGSAGETVPAQSTFTPAFVEALEFGKGDLNQDGYVSGTELGLYLQQEVPQYVDQTPQFGKIADYELSRGDFVFVLPTTRVAKAAEPVNTASERPLSVDPKVIELEFWQSIKDSNEPAMYQAHLEQFPDGTFSSLAKQKLNQIAAAKQAAELEQQRKQEQRQREKAERERKEAERKEHELKLALIKKQQEEEGRQRLAKAEADGITLVAVGDFLQGSGASGQASQRYRGSSVLRSALMTRLPVHGTPFQLVADEGSESAHHIYVQGKVLQIDIRKESEAERRKRIESKRAAATAVGGLLGALTGVGSLGSVAANSVQSSPPRTTVSVIVEVQVLDKRTGKVTSEMARGHEEDAEIQGDPYYFVDAMVLQATELAADAVYKRMAREAGVADTVITQNTTDSDLGGDLLALLKANNKSGQNADCSGGKRDDCATVTDDKPATIVAKAADLQPEPQSDPTEAPGASTQNIAGLWIDDRSCHISIFENQAGNLVGAAWGPHGGSLQIVLTPLIGNERRFDWKGQGRTMFEASLADPKKTGRFTINTYDENKLHTSVNICSKKASGGVSTFHRASSFSSYRVKPPKWYAAGLQ